MVHLVLPGGAILLGIIVILLVLQDAFEVLLLPRRVSRSRRLASTVLRPTWRLWRQTSKLFREGFQSDFLSCYGPLSIVFLYIIWATCLISAYGLCQWGLNSSAENKLSLASCLYLSGSTFFTLGLGDATPHLGLAKILVVAEAAKRM